MSGDVWIGLVILSVPTVVSLVLLRNLRIVQRAASWPSVTGRITAVSVRAESRTRDTTSVRNLPVIEYTYTVSGKTHRGSRIHVVANAGTSAKVDEALARYAVDRPVQVFVDPSNPDASALERDAPLGIAAMYGVIAGLFLAGLAAAAFFLDLDRNMDALVAFFPEGAEPQAVFFFGLAGALTSWIYWGTRAEARRARRWPSTQGSIVHSRVESFLVLSGTPGATDQRVRMYRPFVEYQYAVEGRQYHGARLAFGADTFGPEEGAARRVALHPEGSAVTVHYDPKHPSNAVLDVRIAHNAVTVVLIAASFLLAVYFTHVGR